MRVITVARKPLAGTVAKTALKHGTGGLHIDAARIGTDTRSYQVTGAPGGNGQRLHGGDNRDIENAREYGLRSKAKPPVTVTGRWPANLILQHLPECSQVGTKRVKASTVVFTKEGQGGGVTGVYGDYPTGQSLGVNFGYADEDGKETVANWHCVEGCPVAALDEQSGVSLSSGGNNPASTGVLGNNGIYSKSKGLGDRYGSTLGFGDTGGASRYFKQIGGSK